VQNPDAGKTVSARREKRRIHAISPGSGKRAATCQSGAAGLARFLQ
jgi:hypothetical protein